MYSHCDIHSSFDTNCTTLFVANMLLSRWERACSMAQVAEEALAKLYPQGIIDGYSAVEKWISEEVDSYKCSASGTSKC